MSSIPARHSVRIALALVLLSAGILLATGRGLRADDPPTLPAIHCTLTFNDLVRADEREWVESILKANGADVNSGPGTVEKVTGAAKKLISSSAESMDRDPAADEPVAYTFTVSDPAALDRIHRALMTGHTGSPQPLFNAGTPSYAMNYSTARLDGGLDITVHFTISPDAELFTKQPGSAEQAAGGTIDRTTGRVSLPATLHRGEDFLYARTVRGNVQRFLKIDVYTGESSEIDRATYEH